VALRSGWLVGERRGSALETPEEWLPGVGRGLPEGGRGSRWSTLLPPHDRPEVLTDEMSGSELPESLLFRRIFRNFAYFHHF